MKLWQGREKNDETLDYATRQSSMAVCVDSTHNLAVLSWGRVMGCVFEEAHDSLRPSWLTGVSLKGCSPTQENWLK